MAETISLRELAATGAAGISPDFDTVRAMRALVMRRLGVLGPLLATAFWLVESAIHTWVFRTGSYLHKLLTTDPNELWMRFLTVAMLIAGGAVSAMFVRRLARVEHRNEELHQQLEAALTKLLSGFVPICMYCKSIRDRSDRWEPIEAYLGARTDVQFSHGICPRCFSQHFPGDGVADE